MRVLSALSLGIVLFLANPGVSMAADCQFVLGFKTIRDFIGHGIVGECLENEHYNDMGDSVQHTTGGLLVWRKADNWTAFTDGHRTWINGPNGLQLRLNTERFAWEADNAKTTEEAAENALTRSMLRNAELQTGLFQSDFAFADARVQLVDGIYEDVFRYESNGSTIEQPRTTRIWDEHHFAFGDLNSDGNDDAAVIVGIWEGGNTVHSHLTAFRNDDGVPVHIASILLGATIGIDSLTISDGVITLQTRQPGPNDPACCPSREVLLTYRLTGNAWVLLGKFVQPPLADRQPTQSTAPAVLRFPWNRAQSPAEMLGLQLEKRGLRFGSSSYEFQVRALSLYAHSAYPLYLAYLDSLGVAVQDVGNSKNWDEFVYAYLLNAEYRNEVNGATREYLETTAYLGPILTTYLRGEAYGPLSDRIEFLSLLGNAVWFSYGPAWYRGEEDTWQGECRSGCERVRAGLVELTENIYFPTLRSLPNLWRR